MDSLLPSLDPSSGKANFTSGLLSSLSSLFGPGVVNSGVFASFLADDQPLPVPPPQASTTPPAQNTAAAGSDNEDQDDSGTAAIGTLQNIVGGLNRIINRINNYENKNASNNSSTSSSSGSSSGANSTTAAANTSTTANTGTNTGTQQSQTVTTAGTSAGATTPADSSSDTGSSGGTDTGNNPPGFMVKIVADLTALMKLMEKKLEALQTAAGGTSSSPSTGSATQTSSADGGSSASDPLAQLLALLHTLQQQLTSAANGGLSADVSSTNADASSTNSSGGSAPSPLTDALQDLAQLQKDLKNLMGSLLNAGANNAAGTSAGGSSGATASNTPAVSTGSASNPAPSATDKPSLASQDNLFGMFGGVFGNPLTNAPPAGNSPVLNANANALVAGTDAAGNSSQGTTPQDNGSFAADNGSPNLTNLATNFTPLAGAGDNAQATNPYAFASQLSALRAANGGTVGLPDAVEQVILQMNRGVKDGDDQMSIQLHPAELGKINVKLDISSDGQVRGTVVADNPSTLSMLHKDVRSLERALQEAGLRADPGSLQFSLSGQSGNSPGQTAANGNPGNNEAGGTNSGDDGSGTPLDASLEDNEIYYLTPGRVNFKV